MEKNESKESPADYQRTSLKRDKFFQASLVVILIGVFLIFIGTPNYYSVPPDPLSSTLNLYNLGTFILLLGIILLIAALARYVSNRMSDQDLWWVIKTGPFSRPT